MTEIALIVLVFGLLVLIFLHLRGESRRQGEAQRAQLAFLENVADRLRAAALPEAIEASAQRREHEALLEQRALRQNLPARPQPQTTGPLPAGLQAGRDAMWRAGLDPDNPVDVARWEEQLGPVLAAGGEG